MNDRSKQLFDELETTLRDLPDDRRTQIMEKLEGKQTFRVPEVAGLLDVSETTVRRKLRAGDIPGVKLDKSWRISRAQLSHWWRKKGGGELFESGSSVEAKVAVFRGDNEAETRYLEVGQAAFNSAVSEALTSTLNRSQTAPPVRLKLYHRDKGEDWSKPDGEFVFNQMGAINAYELDWSSSKDDRPERTAVEPSKLLNPFGLVWPDLKTLEIPND